jgi:uncharacterized protein with ATP-grasp and redox domains
LIGEKDNPQVRNDLERRGIRSQLHLTLVDNSGKSMFESVTCSAIANTKSGATSVVRLKTLWLSVVIGDASFDASFVRLSTLQERGAEVLPRILESKNMNWYSRVTLITLYINLN